MISATAPFVKPPVSSWDTQSMPTPLTTSAGGLRGPMVRTGGEAVGPAQDGELLTEGSSGAGEPGWRVVGAVVFHKAYLQVERGEGCRCVREGSRDPEPAAHPTDEPCAYRVVGDEEHPALQFAA